MTRFPSSMLFNPRIRAALEREFPQSAPGEVGAQVKPNKYHNTPVVVDGIRFPSKREAKAYEDLKLAQHCGDVLWFIRQPSFDLPGGIRYRADFLSVWREHGVRVIDAKGRETKEFKLKMRLMAEAYPNVKVELW